MPRAAPEQTVAWVPASKLSTEITRGMTGNASEPTYHTASHRTEFSKLSKMIKSNLCLSLILFKITAKHIGTEKQEIS